jgi:hypothetical protein
MLETSDPLFENPLQQAIASSIALLTPDKQTEMITNRSLLAGDEKLYLYNPILSSISND